MALAATLGAKIFLQGDQVTFHSLRSKKAIMTIGHFTILPLAIFMSGCTPRSSSGNLNAQNAGAKNSGISQLSSSSAGSVITSVSADEMTATTGGDNGDGTYNLWSNGTVSTSINFPDTANYLLDVSAYGSAVDGVWPNMQILVDGAVVQNFNVNSASLAHYQVSLDESAGAHNVAIGFTNDAYDAPEDRNLYFATLTISLSAASAGAAQPTFSGGQFNLTSGATLNLGDTYFTLQVDGNFVAYASNGTALWATSTSSNCANGNCNVTFQTDGNLVIYSAGQPIWSTKTSGHSGSTLNLTTTPPYLTIVGPSHEALYSAIPFATSAMPQAPAASILPAASPTATPTPVLNPATPTGQSSGPSSGQSSGPSSSSSSATQMSYTGSQFTLASNSKLTVGDVTFIMQTDGNFVAYSSSGNALWASSSFSNCPTGLCQVTFQADGNLVAYENGQPFWATNSSGHGGSTLYLLNSAPYVRIIGPNGENLFTGTPLSSSTSSGANTASVPIPTSTPTSTPTPNPTSAQSTSNPSFYVAVSGNDSNPGSLAAPFQTLGRAQSAMESSTTKVVTIRGGTYSVSNGLNLGNADSGQSWVGYAGENAVLDGAGSGGLLVNGANGTLFENLTIQNVGIGFSIVATSNVTMKWNHFFNCTTNCIKANYYCDQILVDSNTFNGGGGNATALAAVFMSFHITNSTVSHNLIQNFGGPGISFAAGTTSNEISTNNVIDRNKVTNTLLVSNDSGAIYILDRTHQATGYQITNNVIDTVGAGSLTSNAHSIYLDDQTSNVLVSGNICRVCGQTAFQYHGGDHNTFTNNLLDLSSGALIGLYQDDPEFGSYGMGMNTFQKNIVYFANAAPASLWSTVMSQGGSALPLVSNNDYFSAGGSAIPNNNPILDSAPAYLNPGFAAPGSGNYSLPTTSPVYTQLGFSALASDQGPLATPASFPH